MATRRASRDYRSRVLDEVTRRVGEQLDGYADSGGRLTALGDPAELAARAAAAIPTAAHAYDARYGPFYDTTGLVRWLGVSRQALADRVRRGALLACRTADGHLVYPASQFTGSGTLRPGLAGVLREFSGVDGWAVLAWLTTPSAAFDGMCATDLLVLGGDPGRVRTAAADDAARWAA